MATRELDEAGLNERRQRAYTLCATVFCVTLVLTNIIGVKLFHLFTSGGPDWILAGAPWTLSVSILTYPVTFLLTDLVSEIWGRQRADFMVYLGFGVSLAMIPLLQMAVALPPSSIWSVPQYDIVEAAEAQRAYGATFANPRLLVFSSMLAYLAAQLLDVRLYHFWWKRTGGRFMWLRNNGSTMVSQLVDTIIVNAIFLKFGIGLGLVEIVPVIIASYLVKISLAAIDTPFVYLGRAFLYRYLRIEGHDASTPPLGT